MKEHWNEIYTWMNTDELGWYEEFPEPSLRLISRCNTNKNEPILDVGTGSSTLIDNLISQGLHISCSFWSRKTVHLYSISES